MAYFKLGNYDANVFLNGFKGIGQNSELAAGTIDYALEAENVETPKGVLQPMAAPTVYQKTFTAKVETFMCFFRRWYSGDGSKNWLVAATDGALYCYHYPMHTNQSVFEIWTQIAFPTGVEAFQSNVWSWVTYEINPAGSEAPVDVLLISNAMDGMYMIVPPYTATESNLTWKLVAIDTQGKKFGVIERYAERIWGGAIPGDPDMLMYSRPFDPTDWTAAGVDEQPEDGAGDIQQPSWDGDSFTALRTFGNQLIAFKKSRVWRILGTDPGEYTFKEQFGGGTTYANTLAVEVERILMVETEGLSVYDGLSVQPFSRAATERFWKTVNKSYLDQACAVMHQNRYYIALPLNNSTVNNALLVYDIEEGTFLVYSGVYIESMLPVENTLYYTSSTTPGRIYSLNYDSWEKGTSAGLAAKWVTPWMDFGRKNIVKGGFELYFNPEVKSDLAATFTFKIETEKRAKTKTIVVQKNVTNPKLKKIKFGGAGRKFRLTITTTSDASVWRIVGGIQLVVEIDPD